MLCVYDLFTVTSASDLPRADQTTPLPEMPDVPMTSESDKDVTTHTPQPTQTVDSGDTTIGVPGTGELKF